MNINDQWNVDLGYQWNSDENRTELAGHGCSTARTSSAINVSYRFRHGSLKEIDVATPGRSAGTGASSAATTIAA